MKSILIVKTSAIGDVIHAFPVVAYLKKRFPNARIDWVVEKNAAALLHTHPDVNQVLELDTKKWRKKLLQHQTEIRSFVHNLRKQNYDLLIDLQGNSKSALVTKLAKAPVKIGFSWKSVPEKPNWFATNHRYFPPKDLKVRERNLYLLQRYFQDETPFTSDAVALNISEEEQERKKNILDSAKLKRQPLFMVCFGSKWKNKQLPEETWNALLQKIHEQCQPSFIFIWSSPEEKEQAERFQRLFPKTSESVGGLSLNLWQSLMKEMSGVLCVDSASLHLAGVSSVPTFSVFGSSSADFYKPTGEKHLSVQGSCPYGKSFQKRCPILRTCSTGACMRDLSADAIFKACHEWLLGVVDKRI
jgi:heptosyltransferase-1